MQLAFLYANQYLSLQEGKFLMMWNLDDFFQKIVQIDYFGKN